MKPLEALEELGNLYLADSVKPTKIKDSYSSRDLLKTIKKAIKKYEKEIASLKIEIEMLKLERDITRNNYEKSK